MQKSFVITIVIMTLLNALDMASTYYSTPDLYQEGNYYVVKYHLGWAGLIFVVIVWQIIYTSFLIYYHFYRKNYFKNDGGIYNTWQLLRTYLFGSRQGFSFLALFAGTFNFLTFYAPVYFCASKILVLISNFLTGAFVKNVTFLSRSNGWSNYYVDLKLPFWSSWYGEFLLYTHDLIKSKQFNHIENGLLFIVLLATVIWYVKIEIKNQFVQS